MNQLEEIRKEINEIKYILEDEGYGINISDETKSGSYGTYLIIDIYSQTKGSMVSKLLRDINFLEFCERVSDICKHNNKDCCVENVTDINNQYLTSKGGYNYYILIYDKNNTWDNLISRGTYLTISNFLNVHTWTLENVKHNFKHIKSFNELIKLDINVGDVVLGGRFKNKKVKVKKIGKNKKGDLTLNGKPLLRFRIVDQEKVNESKFLTKEQHENNIKSVSKEINDILYILEDEGIRISSEIKSYKGKRPGPEQQDWIYIQIIMGNGTKVVDKNLFIDEFEEFFGRVKEITDNYGLYSFKQDMQKTGYAIYIVGFSDKEKLNLPQIDESFLSNRNIYEHQRDIHDIKKYDLTTINKIKEEIEDIFFIIKDVGFEPNIHLSENGANGPWISLDLMYFLPGENLAGRSHHSRKRGNIGVGEYDEFFDRVKEIADRYGHRAIRDKDVLLIYILSKKYKDNHGLVDESFDQERWCIDQIIEEIKPLEYILNDDGLVVETNPRYSQKTSGNCILIKFIPPNVPDIWDTLELGANLRSRYLKEKDKNKETYAEWFSGLVERESYKEYYDRVKEIVEKYGYVITNSHKYDIEIYHKQSKYVDFRDAALEESLSDHDHSQIFKVEEEIKDILYILKDAGIPLPMMDAYNEFYRSWIDINFIHSYPKFIEESEEYLEFFDRVKDISEKYGYKTYKSQNGGYILICNRKFDVSTLKSLVSENKNYLKEWGELNSRLENIIKELKDLDFILNDDGYSSSIRTDLKGYYLEFPRAIITVLVVTGRHTSSDDIGYSWGHIHEKDLESDCVSEYLDRVRDVCDEYKCSISSYKNKMKTGSPGLFVISPKG